MSIEGQICNQSGTGQNLFLCDSNFLIAVFKHNGTEYPDDLSVVPAETLIAMGGYANVSNLDYSLIAGRNEVSTFSATLNFDAGKFTYGPVRDEELAVTFDELCEMVA